MLKQLLTILTMLSVLAGGLPAEEKRGDSGDAAVSTFVGTAFYGTGLGAFTGLAAGWVRYADRHEMQNVWESAGYGALGGAGLGLAAAVLGRDGSGKKILSDIDMASGFGGGIGCFWGIVSALFTGESPRIANGIAWGHLAGFVLGLGAAGYKVATRQYAPAEETEQQAPLSVRVQPGSDGFLLNVERRF